MTGLSFQTTDLAAKRLELLREIAPGIRRLGVSTPISAMPLPMPEIDEVQAAARILGLEVVAFGDAAGRGYNIRLHGIQKWSRSTVCLY